MSDPWRRAVAAAALVAAATIATPVVADEDDDAVVVALPAYLLNSGFAAYAIASGFRGQPVQTAVIVPQLIAGIPQYLGLNIMLGLASYDDRLLESDADPELVMLLMLGPAMMSTAMTFHGLVTAMGEELDPGRVVGISTIAGVNLPLTFTAAGRGLTGRWAPPLVALVQVATTAPSLAGGMFAAAIDEPDRPGWALLSGWSGLLLIHGVASLVASEGYDELEDYAGAATRTSPTRTRPAGFELWASPTMLTDGAEQAPGLVLEGRF